MADRQIILDTETTGLRVDDGHRVIEIGCVEMINRKLTGETYHQYVNPEREVEQGALAVHGITNEFLVNKPRFADIASEFMAFVHGADLIIHNAPFDISFLDYELVLTRKGWNKMSAYCQIIDTLLIARKLHVGQRNNLDALCKRYYVDNTRREYHGALLDAHLLAQVYLAMTGGQGNFFDQIHENRKQTANVSQAQAAIAHINCNLTVLSADEEEQKAHEAYLDELEKKGKCLWRMQEVLDEPTK